MTNKSKTMSKGDDSLIAFIKELSDDKPLYGINMDMMYWDSEENRYTFIEYLKCEESQFVNPGTSHPEKYWYKNWQKFTAQWALCQAMSPPAKYILVNYAAKGTENEDIVKVMEVVEVDPGPQGTLKHKVPSQIMTRAKYKEYFWELNNKSKRDLTKI